MSTVDEQTVEAIAAAINKIEEMGIGQKRINFRLRDANFSRQRYWGEPFPIKYDADGIAHGHYHVAVKGLHSFLVCPFEEGVAGAVQFGIALVLHAHRLLVTLEVLRSAVSLQAESCSGCLATALGTMGSAPSVAFGI